MDIRIAGGVEDHGIVVGNAFDKYASRNPIVKWMMRRFDNALTFFVKKASPKSIYELGCGEGFWVLKWNRLGYLARGSDFSESVIKIAQDNANARGVCQTLFEIRNIYDINAEEESADLIVCCEVLEHLESPDLALRALQKIVKKHLIVSVPREPLWCILNMLRAKYLTRWGNTPGHIQHWSKTQFIHLISNYFEIIDIQTPIPWTMILCRPRQ